MIRPTRWVASAAATTVAASGLALVAAAPATAAPAPSLRWEISQQFDDHLSSHELGDGATESADGVITFPSGVGSYDAATGAGSVTYDGSVAGSFLIPVVGTAAYTVTFADPTVTVDADGEGTISAVVSAKVSAGRGQPATEVAPARVTVTTFDAPGWTVADGLGSITATPDWAGVLAAGSAEATALEIPEGQPVDGQAWSADLLGHLPSGLRAHFYASGTSDAKKAPADFTAQASTTAAGPAVTYRTTAASPSKGLTLEVSGTGFDGTTNPGDNGVYVGLAPAGGLPDTDDMGDQAKFAAATWVPAAQITDGSFTTSLTAPTAKLRRGTSYALYTWQAHSHSNTSQDTETPVTIAWAKLAPVKAKATVKVAKLPTPSRAGKLKVVYRGSEGTVAGKVTVKVKRGGKVVATRAAKLARGKATVGLPKLARGSYRLKVVYAGSPAYQRVVKTVALTVTR
ncbi:HtaA domain-containing protein [Nocardioides marmotae]|uniref:HtaA domain-containing protein n=1 Tax=Nocardioides marmotae TaxID=2663857 RepID=UPI0012B5115E|nr:HtaA domain-containing protein [Nocardioides marmotae]MBC9733626.1 HtaA domain-containing protein [Nocardioides marmotae]MTB84729.1 hypothetical protein [Nocardioides marmotae]